MFKETISGEFEAFAANLVLVEQHKDGKASALQINWHQKVLSGKLRKVTK